MSKKLSKEVLARLEALKGNAEAGKPQAPPDKGGATDGGLGSKHGQALRQRRSSAK